jgi:hypothetical protein
MAIEQGILQLLTGDEQTSALVGARVFWILAPKGAVLPYVILSRVTTSDDYDTLGATGFRHGLFQADCYATDFYTSRAIAQAVRMLLESYYGNLPDTDATPVSGVVSEKDFDLTYEAGGKGFVFRAVLEFRFHFYDTALPVTAPAGGEGTLDGGLFSDDF